MADENISDIINNAVKEGHSPQEIHDALVEQGMTAAEADEAIKKATGQKAAPAETPTPTPAPKEKPAPAAAPAKPETSKPEPAPAAEKPKKSISPVLIIIIVVVVLGLLAGAYYFFMMPKEEEPAPVFVQQTEEEVAEEAEEEIMEEEESAEEAMEMAECTDTDCFEQKFADCEPVMFEYKLMDGLAYYYEIIGPAEEGICEVKSHFTENPNPDYIGKEMTCQYDNTITFETAIQDMDSCEGELYNIMTGVTDDTMTEEEFIVEETEEEAAPEEPVESTGVKRVPAEI